ncbi:MAG: type I-E CRISPR-associated endonuclease Cas1 [Anaerolineaceae bacterium]|nr:type I-E CRISPR-associated endonuclease Cas1 [Anaerolineaceae bacterium]
MKDLHELPKLRDSLSYLYIEHAIIERQDFSVEVIQETGRTHVPAANLCVLMLGPGTSITHAAVKILADNGCTILWGGEEMTRFYAAGVGETRRAYHVLKQAESFADATKHEEVVRRMYMSRFGYELEHGLSLQQIRGMEGVRIKKAYQIASQKYNIPWEGRRYDRNNWEKGDSINRTLSTANALLNSICHAAIVSGGYSPALGFIHSGHQLSFVFDIADLYKVDITIPMAFQITAMHPENPELFIRPALREHMHAVKLLDRILPDIDALFELNNEQIRIREEGKMTGLYEPLWEGVMNETEEEL